MENRLARLRAVMSQRDIDAVLITCEVNQSWVSGFDFTDGYILVCRENAYLITDPRYIEAAKKTAGLDFECVCAPSDVSEMISGYLSDNFAKTLGIEDMELSYHRACALKGALDGVEIVCLGTLFDDLRAVKDADEAEKIKQAQRITDAAFSHILGYIKEGVSEVDIAIELEFFMRRMGADGPSFEFIVASGSASSMPHAQPRKTLLERGFLTIDMGCVYRGYCSDMTRTVVLGSADREMKKLYNTVLDAQRAALDFITEGVRCADADRAARDITEREYPMLFSHSLGHGVGRLIHESPRLSARAGDKRLSRGHVVTVEPGIYIEGRYGCRIEDMVIIGDGCAENITKSTKELIEL